MTFLKFLLTCTVLIYVSSCSNSFHVNSKKELDLREVWERPIGNGQDPGRSILVPAIEDTTLYASDADGIVIAVDIESRKIKWQKKIKEPLSAGITVGHDLVLVVTVKGIVIAINAETGDEKWRSKVDDEVLSPPAINEKVVLIQTQSDSIIALDVSTGRECWSYKSKPNALSLRGTGSPLITGNSVIAGLSTGEIISLNILNGIPAWKKKISTPIGLSEIERMTDIDGGVILSGSKIYAASYQGNIVALDPNNGSLLWKRKASTYRSLAEGFGSIYIVHSSGIVECIDESTHTTLWVNNFLKNHSLSSPKILSSYLVIGDMDGNIYSLSQVDGHLVSKVHIDNKGVLVPPLSNHKSLYVLGNSGKLKAFSIN